MQVKIKSSQLNVGAASPAGDMGEYGFAWAALRQEYPELPSHIGSKVTYIGSDGTHHYFQDLGDPLAYRVAVSAGWTCNV